MSDSTQVRLVRPIRYAGEIVAAGSVLSTSVAMAAELVHARKAVPHVEEPPAEAAKATVVVDQAPVAADLVLNPL